MTLCHDEAMQPATFTTIELQAADEAFQRHVRAQCGRDCSFCEDLRNSVRSHHKEEYQRIKKLKNRPALGTPKQVKRKGAYKPPLAGRVKR